MHKYIYFNGEIIQRQEFVIGGLSASVQFGLSPFEGVRSYKNQRGRQNVVELDKHLDRLQSSCDALSIDINICNATITNALKDLVRCNDVPEDAAFRIIVVSDLEKSWQDIDTNAKLAIAGINRPEITFQQKQIVRLATSTNVYKPHVKSFPFQVKLGANYINSRYAHIEAKRNGYDGAVLLTQDSYISENGGANIAFVKDNTLVIPATESNILDGITLQIIEKICEKIDLNVERRFIHVDELATFDEAFICGTAVELQAVSVNEHNYASQYTKQLYDHYINTIRTGSLPISIRELR